MAKGQAQAANKQLATTNDVAANLGTQQQGLSSKLTPLYTSMLNEGYTPGQKSAMTEGATQGANSAFGTASDEAARSAGRTGNEAGLTAANDELALGKGQAMSNTGANLEQQFANKQQQNTMYGLQGLGNLEGQDLQGMESMYGLGPGTLQARAAGGPSPLWGLAQSTIGAAGQVGAAAL